MTDHEADKPFGKKSNLPRSLHIPRNMRATVRRGRGRSGVDQRARVRAEHIYYFLGVLMQRYLRPVQISDLARILGYQERHLYLILEGKRTGGARMVKRFLRLTRFGIVVHEKDFMQLPPRPAHQPPWEELDYDGAASGSD